MQPDTRPLTVRDVSERLGIAGSTVRKLVYARRLSHYRIGGALRFDAVDVEEFRQAARVEAGDAA